MKVEAMEFIHDYSVTHGRDAVRRNAQYLANLLKVKEKDVLEYIPPEIECDEPYGIPEEQLEAWQKEFENPGRKRRLEKDIRKAAQIAFTLAAARKPASTSKKDGASRAKKPARRAAKTKTSASSDDGAGGSDGEPPRQLYTFKSFAQLVDCSEKTLRNKVSAGLFPQPQKTAFGPRFTQQHLDYAVTPAKPPKKRGRPRIADSIQGGVQ